MRTPKSPRLVTIAIITTATIILWIFFEVYRIFTAASPLDVPEELLRPINPALDSKALLNVQGRAFFEDEEIPESPIAPPSLKISVEPVPTETPIPKEEVSPTPTATGSAEF